MIFGASPNSVDLSGDGEILTITHGKKVAFYDVVKYVALLPVGSSNKHYTKIYVVHSSSPSVWMLNSISRYI